MKIVFSKPRTLDDDSSSSSFSLVYISLIQFTSLRERGRNEERGEKREGNIFWS